MGTLREGANYVSDCSADSFYLSRINASRGELSAFAAARARSKLDTYFSAVCIIVFIPRLSSTPLSPSASARFASFSLRFFFSCAFRFSFLFSWSSILSCRCAPCAVCWESFFH